jgi:acyl-CoA reductase-like NAD-dependent aldehyde dehydrogenase
MYDRFVERFVSATQALVIGDGRQETTQVGPLANQRQLEKWKRWWLMPSPRAQLCSQAESVSIAPAISLNQRCSPMCL